jgi:Tol biopolymer transport system component
MSRNRWLFGLLLGALVVLAGLAVSRGVHAAPTGYLVYGAPDGNIWRMAADGSGRTRLTQDGTADHPVWVPGGGLIVFSSQRDGKAQTVLSQTLPMNQVYIMGSDGSKPNRLSDGSGDDRWADVFPDGRQLLVMRSRNYRPITGTISYDVQLVTMGLDGSNSRVVSFLPSTSQVRYDGFPARVSPDGQSTVLVRESQGKNSLLATVSLTSGVGSLIQPDIDKDAPDGSVEYLWPQWTPDGRIAVLRRGYTFSPRDNALLTMDRNGKNAQVLVSGLTYEALAAGFDVDWTGRIVWAARAPEMPGGQRPEELYSIDLATSGFSAPLDSGHGPAWSATLGAPPPPTAVSQPTAPVVPGSPVPGTPAPPGPPLITTADPLFSRVWERADRAVLEGKAGRSWTWGPQARTGGLQEPYAGLPGDTRLVQYFDKARMELHPAGDNSPAYVTNGLLVVEMMSGKVQVGDNQSESREPAAVQIGGDGPNNPAPSYALLGRVASLGGENQVSSRVGQPVGATLAPDGSTANDPTLARKATVATFIKETGHNIPDVFWTFLNQRGLVYTNGAYREDALFDWVFTMGYPVTEAYWTKQTVGGKTYDVLVQAFQRQVLTYTPDNAPPWRVQFGNVALHYYTWRYGKAP